jgi:hypothetical protein
MAVGLRIPRPVAYVTQVIGKTQKARGLDWTVKRTSPVIKLAQKNALGVVCGK